MRALDDSIDAPAAGPFVLRAATVQEIPIFARLVLAGFTEKVVEGTVAWMAASASAENLTRLGFRPALPEGGDGEPLSG